ncbi:hypothetical protein C8R44DRAFT_828716 [Mycena epipterygia]|nr:hypothetical protein C8R44DRAFT_828716 [Mycena epipterygia]
MSPTSRIWLNVTKPDDILSAFACVVGKFGRVDVVFNNAGCGTVGEVEATPEDAARALFDVNFLGAAAVSREAIQVFRDFNSENAGGRLLNVSSGLSFSGGPILAFYSASNSLEEFTDSLRLEMNPAWNIKISIIAPGAFKTHAHTRGTVMLPAPDAYSGEGLSSKAIRQWVEDGSGIPGDPLLAAKAIFRFSMVESPPVRWAMGKDTVAGVRKRTKHVTEETDEFESWSENLELV